jgi:molybdate transport system substrate-binding protein
MIGCSRCGCPDAPTANPSLSPGVTCYSVSKARKRAGEELTMNTFSFIISAALLFYPAAASAQLNVIISGGFSGAYEQLLPEFERTSGIKVTTGSGASQGTGPQTIAAQLARGVPADVVILSREGLSELIAAKRIVAGTDVDLARVGLGVAVRAGTPKPDVSTVDAFKQVVLKAKTIAVPGSTSGIWLTTDLFPRLGIGEKVNVKATPRGKDATGMVAAGDADLAVMAISEIVHAAGVDLAGSIAPEIQFIQVFSAAVVAGSGEIEGTKRLIEFLASARASEAIRNSGMEPVATSR